MVELSMVNAAESKKVIWLKIDKWRAKLTFYLQFNEHIQELKTKCKNLKKY